MGGGGWGGVDWVASHPLATGKENRTKQTEIENKYKETGQVLKIICNF